MENTIRLLKIERECVSRDCDRECAKCDLVQDRYELLAAFDDAISMLKAHEPKKVHAIDNVGVSDVQFGDCPWCAVRIHDDESRDYCGHCGKAVKWCE